MEDFLFPKILLSLNRHLIVEKVIMLTINVTTLV